MAARSSGDTLAIDAAIRNYVARAGGARQRISAGPERAKLQSGTEAYVQEEWAWGHLYATKCQEPLRLYSSTNHSHKPSIIVFDVSVHPCMLFLVGIVLEIGW
jgi:hypothetical protein